MPNVFDSLAAELAGAQPLPSASPAPGVAPNIFHQLAAELGTRPDPHIGMPVPPALQGAPEPPAPEQSAGDRLKAAAKGTRQNSSDILSAVGGILSGNPELGAATSAPPTAQQVQAFHQALDRPPVTFSQALPPGAAQGAAEALEGVVTPKNLMILAGTTAASAASGGAAPAAALALRAVNLGLTGYFSAQMAQGLSERGKSAYAAWQRGDLVQVAHDLGAGTVEGLLLALGLKHGVPEAAKLARNVSEAVRTTPPAVAPTPATPPAAPAPAIEPAPSSTPPAAPVANRNAGRPKQGPIIPESGVPENVARAMDARENLAQNLLNRPWAQASNPERLAIDDLIAQGYQGTPTPRPAPGQPAPPQNVFHQLAAEIAPPRPTPGQPAPLEAPAAATPTPTETVSMDSERDRVAQQLAGNPFAQLKPRDRKVIDQLVRESAREHLASTLTQKPYAELGQGEQRAINALIREGYAGERPKAAEAAATPPPQNVFHELAAAIAGEQGSAGTAVDFDGVPQPQPASPARLSGDSAAPLEVTEPPPAGGADTPTPRAIGPHGPIFPELAGRPREAIAKLQELQSGEVPGAWNHPHPEVGDIDLVWGKPGDAQKNFKGGYGLAHMIEKHVKAQKDLDLDQLPDAIAAMQPAGVEQGNRLILQSPDHKAIVVLDWDGRAKKWLLSAYRPGEEGTKPSLPEGPSGVPGTPEGGSLTAPRLRDGATPSVTSNESPAQSPAPEAGETRGTSHYGAGGATLSFLEPPTPAESFEAAFQPKTETHIEASGLGALFGKLLQPQRAGEPLRDYSALGAFKDKFVRNLSQLEEASPEAHAATVRAAASRAQAITLMRSAWPLVEKALAGKISSTDFKGALVESRLRGLRDRWLELADRVESLPDDKLQSFIEHGPLQVLAAMPDTTGFGRDLATVAAAHLEQGDTGALRDFAADEFRRAADRVAQHMTPERFDRLTQTPEFSRAMAIYKEHIERVLAENHATNEGVFTDALGPLDTYFPLMSLSKEEAATLGKRTPFKRPANPFNDFATGLAPAYDVRNEALLDRMARAFKTNDKAAALGEMQKAGLLVPLAEGQRAPKTITFDGKTYQADVVEISPVRQRQTAAGEYTTIPARAAVVPSWLAGEIKPIFESPAPPKAGALARVLDVVNKFAITGLADPIMHSSNLVGALVGNTPWLGDSFAEKTIGNTPVTKVFTALGKLITTNPMDESAVYDLREMAKLGLLPERFASGTYSKTFAEQTGAKHETFSLGPFLYGPQGVDVRARLVMYRVAKQIDPQASPKELYTFVNQLGNYTRTLQGSVERALKSTGFSPFYTAGSTMLRNGVDTWTGTGSGSGPGGKTANRIAQQLSGGAVGLIAAWAITYKATTDKWPWQDSKMKLLQIPAPAWFRESDLGRALWGNDSSKAGYVNFSFFSPHVLRGARALGLNGAVNTAAAGGNAAQIAQAAKRDAANAQMQPVFGPAARATMLAATGKQPYLVNDLDSGGSKFLPGIDKKAPIGSELLEAAKDINSLAGNVGAATGLGSEPGGRDTGRAWFANILEMLRLIGKPVNPYATRDALTRERNRHR